MRRVLYSIGLCTGILIGTMGLAYAETSTCTASWYGPGFHGRDMANGERFNQNDPTTVAHKSLPFGTKLLVTKLDTGKSIKVEVRDDGPHNARCLDLSKAGAAKLGFIEAGTAKVKFTILYLPPGKKFRGS